MQEERSDGDICSPGKDFLRNIVNHVLADISEKLPVNVFNEIKNMLSRAEDKYRFSVYGGDPRKLADYLSSEDWSELVQYAINFNVEWVLLEILRALEEAYKDTCPVVARAARKAYERILEIRDEKSAGNEGLTAEALARIFRMRGYKVNVEEDGLVVVQGSTYEARIEIVDGFIRYTICRKGKAQSVDGLEAKLKKITEI